jgi:uncharacterized DUF497 family protein
MILVQLVSVFLLLVNIRIISARKADPREIQEYQAGLL